MTNVYRFSVTVTIETPDEGYPGLTVEQVQALIEVALDEHADLNAIVTPAPGNVPLSRMALLAIEHVRGFRRSKS